MATVKTELTNSNKIKITFVGRKSGHIRTINGWLDWMLEMNDFRDLIVPLRKEDVDFIITKLLNDSNKLLFRHTNLGQEYNISEGKKIVRRSGPGRTRLQYQSVALFVENNQNIWPPPPIEIDKEELLQLVRSMITLDCPANYCITDSLRNLQYLVAILWIKEMNPKLLQGEKKPKADEIFRISLVK